MVQTAANGITGEGTSTSSCEVRFRNRSDLLLDNLTKQATPLEFLTWLDKFRYWIGASFGLFQPESVSVANELSMKLDADWTA